MNFAGGVNYFPYKVATGPACSDAVMEIAWGSDGNIKCASNAGTTAKNGMGRSACCAEMDSTDPAKCAHQLDLRSIKATISSGNGSSNGAIP